MMKKPVPPSLRQPLLVRPGIEALEPRWMLSSSPWGGGADDLFWLDGTHLTVRGTAAPDTIEFSAGSEYRIAVNGAGRQFASGAIDRITLLADADDTVILRDTAGDDTLIAEPHHAELSAPGVTVRSLGAGTLLAYGGAGGVDVAHLSDSAGDDTLTSTPALTEMTGDGFRIRVESFDFVHGYARNGGNDLALLYGSPGDDTLVGRDTWSRISGEGYANRVKFFDRVIAYAGGGENHARLYDSPGDDYFLADPSQATLSGDRFSVQAIGFASVTAYATSGGMDWAELVDSPGDDTFYGNPTEAALFGSGYLNRAIFFNAVHAYARHGGYDIANLHDSPGDDTYVGSKEWGRLFGSAFFLRAKLFDSIHAYADSGGYDTAQLIGSPGNDVFVGREEYSRLSGEGYEHRVGAFDFVLARAGGRGNQAFLFDSPAADLLVAEDQWVRLIGGESESVRMTTGFGKVTARLGEAGDQSVVTGSSSVDLQIGRSVAATLIAAADYLDPSSPTWGFQAAIDALPDEGGVVVLPAGTYTLRQGLVLRSGVTLRGADAGTILMRPNRLEARLVGTAQTGDSVLLVASTQPFGVGDEVAVLAYGQPNVAQAIIRAMEPGRLLLDRPIAVEGRFAPSDDATVINYFPLVRAHWAHEGARAADIVLENLILDGNLDETTETWRISGPALLQLQNSAGAVVRNSTIRNAASGGIHLEGGSDNRIEKTTIQKVRGHGIYLFREADTVVSEVVVRQAGYATKGTSGDGIMVDGSSDILVENSLTERSFRYGLHPGGELNRGGVWRNNVSRNNGSNGYHFCWDNFDILVTGNVLENNGRSGVGGLGLGGEFGDMFNTVSGNLIRGNARHGIEINGGTVNYLIGNTIVDNSQLRTGQFSGIVLADARFVTVSGNVIGAGGSPVQKFGVEEYGRANDNLITGNQATGNRAGGVHVTGATTFLADNTGKVVQQAN